MLKLIIWGGFLFKLKKAYIIILIIPIFLVILYFTNFKNTVTVSSPVSTSPSVRLPIIMYHQVLKNANSLGKYIISPREFEGDVKYLKESGYTTIDVQDLIDFVNNKKKLPDKPIMLTFDDGYLSNYTYIVPILEKYEVKAVISIVGEYVDKSSIDSYTNPYLNWTQVKELVDHPNVEIQNHTYSMHDTDDRKGCSILEGEPYDKYKMEILEDIGYFQLLIQEKTGYTPTAFTYPYGYVCDEVNGILEEIGFISTFSCKEGVNLLSGNKDELYELKRFNRPSGINRERFFKKFEK